MPLFTSFAFPTADLATATHPRTMPTRLTEVKNVRDFGAVGDGSTNDLPAIMAALNWRTGNTVRGLVYFPPGDYFVNGPIDFGSPGYPNSGPYLTFAGEMGASTIIGDFADYVFKRSYVDGGRWYPEFMEKLTIINRHINGGGIRLGLSQGCCIRDCDITANIAINDENSNFLVGNNAEPSFELDIYNCNCRPFNVLAAGSTGLYKGSCGPVVNCTFIGFDLGMGTFSGQGATTVHGCYFEGNNIGFSQGRSQSNFGGGGNLTMSGCWFKNNGIGIDRGGGNCNYLGIRIEAAAGSIPGEPQYGIRVLTALANQVTFQGVTVTGAYQQAGVYFQGGENGRYMTVCMGIGVTNSIGPNKEWGMPTSGHTAQFKYCNNVPVFTVLPASTTTINSTSWTPSIISGTSAYYVRPGFFHPDQHGFILEEGNGYVGGQYNNVPLTGGSGTGRRANIKVNAFSGRVEQVLITVAGSGYGLNDVLSASNTNLGGSGANFTIVSNWISGSGYVPGEGYIHVPLTGGSGTGATADFKVDASGVIFECIVKTVVTKPNPFGGTDSAGTNYVVGDVLSVSNANLGGTGSGFSIRVTAVQNTATVNFQNQPATGQTDNVAYISIAGHTPAGYNGLYQGTFTAATRVEYPLPTNPGGSGGAVGTIFLQGGDRNISRSAYEGDLYDISNGNANAWGAAVSTGGSNHVKVRYTETQWTVVGK